jgi:hypothetical protein
LKEWEFGLYIFQNVLFIDEIDICNSFDPDLNAREDSFGILLLNESDKADQNKGQSGENQRFFDPELFHSDFIQFAMGNTNLSMSPAPIVTKTSG